MWKRIIKIILGVLLVLVVLAAIAAVLGPPYIRNRAQKSFPILEGEITLKDLNDTVEVYRDSYGVPHIFGTNHHDIFFAQGYVHAQDRFWQMDLWRHQGAGRLSELVGEPMLETDKFLRTLGWERVAQQEVDQLGSEELAILESYSAGVNAYLEDRTGVDLSLEYFFLPLINPGYEPAPWTPLNSLTWGKAMAWDLRGNLSTEINRAKLLKDLSPAQVDFIYPTYPEDHPLIVPGFKKPGVGDIDTPPQNESSYSHNLIQNPYVQQSLLNLELSVQNLDQLRRAGIEGLGSNSWAVSGKLTDTGFPYLANDPHLSTQMPSIWYEVGLHCIEKTPDCRLNITGFSFAGVPGIIIGHNDRIAWGMTNVGPDVMDLYIEKINRDNPDLYLTPDGWQELETVIEVIEIAGKKPVEHTVRISRHGPLIESVYGLEDFHLTSGLDLPEQYALALRWTALEPTCTFCAVWEFNQANSWEDFREAASRFSVPSQNLIYADVEGNIAYQLPGNIPIRNPEHDGLLPVPGWVDDFEWQGYIPFSELPYSLNPESGYIVTANNAAVDQDYPYLINLHWDRGFRAQRLVDLINSGPQPITREYMKIMQGDNYDPAAEILVPILLDLKLDDPALQTTQQLLLNWDYQAELDSQAAALFMVFWQNLVQNTFQDNMPEDYHVGVNDTGIEIIRQLINEPDNIWWDDADTPARETMEDIFRISLEESYRELVNIQGEDPADWQWGSLHTVTFENQVMSSFPLINNTFNRGPYPASGGNEIVNATGWRSNEPYQINSLPSMRMIVDLSDLSKSLSIHTTGQSGHANHQHYTDMTDLWRKIRYHPQLWTKDQIQDQSVSLLILSP
jgi:penicillin amidase